MKPRLQDHYQQQIVPKLREELGRDNLLSLPRLEKIVINMGVGSAVQDKKFVEDAADTLTALAGQKSVVTRARKSIANFRLREEMPIGAKVTLRGARMYEFLDRLINLVLPRVRDFRGISYKAFDGRGNYSLGLTERLVFPEVNADKYTRPQGMNVVIVTNVDSDDESRRLLELFGMPFRSRTSKSSGAA
ncbi:MAG TPA: 50S ribosomal protein L5 [Planctomycetaceae bacterium]|nr:50S ribosomal protein L5 [Planctomycetaceae bacterium]HRF00389.1 50S ribosomal protein L5 [Pirellulaceae bacterium]